MGDAPATAPRLRSAACPLSRISVAIEPLAAVFAIVYDPFLALGELAGLRRRRRRLLASARGRVVELGAGTGLNLRHYPDGLEALILVEPDAAMRRRLARRVRRSGRAADIVEASAERLPLRRPLGRHRSSRRWCCARSMTRSGRWRRSRASCAPDGKLLFLEHVRAHSPRLARWQHRLQRTLAALRLRLPLQPRHGRADARLRVRARRLAEATWRAMPPIVRPLAIGHARPRGTA